MEEKKILIVEDEWTIAAEIKRILLNAGCGIIGIAKSGEKAIELAEKQQPDLVVMDIRLKTSMNGVKAAIKIGKMYDYLVPILYLTNEKDPIIVEYASRDNNKITAYFSKRPDMKELDLPTKICFMLEKAEEVQQKLEQEQQKLAEEEKKREEELEEMRKKLEAALAKEEKRRKREERDSFFVNSKSGEQKQIDVKDVLFIETDKRGNGILIIVADTEYTLDKSLTKFLEDFPHKSFVRVHTSYIVNRKEIDTIKKKEEILLKKFHTIIKATHKNIRFFVNNNTADKWNGIIPIGRKYRDNINDLL